MSFLLRLWWSWAQKEHCSIESTRALLLYFFCIDLSQCLVTSRLWQWKLCDSLKQAELYFARQDDISFWETFVNSTKLGMLSSSKKSCNCSNSMSRIEQVIYSDCDVGKMICWACVIILESSPQKAYIGYILWGSNSFGNTTKWWSYLLAWLQ